MTDENNQTKTAEILPLPQVTEKDALEVIDRRNALFERVLSVAIAATNPNDWKDMGGKPYLESSGCEKVARRFGVSITDVTTEREDLEDDNGRYYLYTTMGKASFGRGYEVVEAIGTGSSRDKFFAKNKNGSFKPIQDVDIANIKKKSYTNMYGNGVRKLLGINNLTWEMLEKFGVIKGGKITKVAYDKGASKASETKTAQVAEAKAKKPYWTNDWNGKTYMNVRVGKHFSEEFLRNIGLRPSKSKPDVFGGEWTEEIQDALDVEFVAAEEAIAIQNEGSGGVK